MSTNDRVRQGPLLTGDNADVIVNPEHWLSFKRMTGSEAISAGVPVLLNPKFSRGNFIAALAETADTVEWQGCWIDPGSTMSLHKICAKDGQIFPGLSFDPADIANQAVRCRRDVTRVVTWRAGGMNIWGGYLQWSHSLTPIRPEGLPRGRAHAVAFDWLSHGRDVEVVGVYQVCLPGRSKFDTVKLIEDFILDDHLGTA